MEIQITDPKTGHTATIHWPHDDPPTPEEEAQIFQVLSQDINAGATTTPPRTFTGDFIARGIENAGSVGKAVAGLTPWALMSGKVPGQEMAEGLVGSVRDLVNLQGPAMDKVGAAIGRGAPWHETALRGAAAGLEPLLPMSDAMDALYTGHSGSAAADAVTAAVMGRLGAKVAKRWAPTKAAPAAPNAPNSSAAIQSALDDVGGPPPAPSSQTLVQRLRDMGIEISDSALEGPFTRPTPSPTGRLRPDLEALMRNRVRGRVPLP